jgi:hypothetical protein
MKHYWLILTIVSLISLPLSSLIAAEKTVPVLKAHGREFKQVKVVTSNFQQVTIKHEQGTSKLAWKGIALEEKEKLGYDPNKHAVYPDDEKSLEKLASATQKMNACQGGA